MELFLVPLMVVVVVAVVKIFTPVVQVEKSQSNPTQKIQSGIRDTLGLDDDQSTKGEGCKDQTGMSVGPTAKVKSHYETSPDW